MKRLTVFFTVMFVILTYTTVQAQETQVTPTPDDHAAHHPATETPPTPQSDTSSDLGMEMGDPMGVMDMMSMMTQMSEMMDTMQSMDMSDEMHAEMQQMHEMMMAYMGMSDPMSTMNAHASSGMGEHAMGPISREGVPPATQSIGGLPLDYRLEDDVKVFEITAQPVLWNILDDVAVTAWTYNGTVPGPMIRVTEGDRVRVIFTNNLPKPTTVHWHGILVPNATDGVPAVTQDPILPGETFIYEFTASPSGTFMYHSHFESDVQIGLGLYAPFIIDPAQPQESGPDVDLTLMLSEWRVVNGQTFAAMPMAELEPNYFTINGKSFPSAETINVRLGQRVRLRLANIGQFSHPMHLHGMPFQIVATDGYTVPQLARLTKDTVSIDPGERYDIEFVAAEPGQWILHCHITHHATNDGQDPGGLMLLINVTE